MLRIKSPTHFKQNFKRDRAKIRPDTTISSKITSLNALKTQNMRAQTLDNMGILITIPRNTRLYENDSRDRDTHTDQHQ